MSAGPRIAAILLAAGTATTTTAPTSIPATPVAAAPSAPVTIRVPMVCNHGDKNQNFRAVVTVPEMQPPGATFEVRIDSLPSGSVSHFGLHYLHDMITDYVIPDGARYIEGSAQIVPGSGTPNASAGAVVSEQGGLIRLQLPARIQNGSAYTPPSISFRLLVVTPAGSVLALQFAHFEVSAHVILLGEIRTTCDPPLGPQTIAVTRVVR